MISMLLKDACAFVLLMLLGLAAAWLAATGKLSPEMA
jgi:hypothetical protein